jgi:hypothetical protein
MAYLVKYSHCVMSWDVATRCQVGQFLCIGTAICSQNAQASLLVTEPVRGCVRMDRSSCRPVATSVTRTDFRFPPTKHGWVLGNSPQRLSSNNPCSWKIFAACYSQYINQKIHLIKHDLGQVWNSYMFRHITSPSRQPRYCIALTGMNCVLLGYFFG